MHDITQSNKTYTALFDTHLRTVCKLSRNCVSFVVIFFHLLELTLKTQVSNTVNTVGISSNVLFGNSANNFLNYNLSLDAKFLSTFDLPCWLPFFVYAKIT